MPGYRALPLQFTGPAAEHVRYAEVLQRAGDPAQAIFMLESTLDLYARTEEHLPGWICGRLAALYRTLDRLDDEVRLLERYRESQLSDDVRTRFDARLSKAHAIAERKRRTETRALSSVRRVINGREDDDMPRAMPAVPADDSFTSATVQAMRDALLDAASHDGVTVSLRDATARICLEAHECEYPPERVAIALKSLWEQIARPAAIGQSDWDALYRRALTGALAVYFDDPPR